VFHLLFHVLFILLYGQDEVWRLANLLTTELLAHFDQRRRGKKKPLLPNNPVAWDRVRNIEPTFDGQTSCCRLWCLSSRSIGVGRRNGNADVAVRRNVNPFLLLFILASTYEYPLLAPRFISMFVSEPKEQVVSLDTSLSLCADFVET
jgi:hypothetical protein